MDYSDLMELKNIDLVGLTEPGTNSLILLFSRSSVNPVPVDLVIGDKVIKGCHPVERIPDLPFLQLSFDSYIAYGIRNESFAYSDGHEIFEGKSFRMYSASIYLDYIKNATWATEEYPGPFRHYAIICLNHVIDVVSTVAPEVTEVEPVTSDVDFINGME